MDLLNNLEGRLQLRIFTVLGILCQDAMGLWPLLFFPAQLCSPLCKQFSEDIPVLNTGPAGLAVPMTWSPLGGLAWGGLNKSQLSRNSRFLGSGGFWRESGRDVQVLVGIPPSALWMDCLEQEEEEGLG